MNNARAIAEVVTRIDELTNDVLAIADTIQSPSERDWDHLISAQIAADELRGDIEELARTMKQRGRDVAPGIQLALDPDRIRSLASEPADEIPAITPRQAGRVVSILANVG